MGDDALDNLRMNRRAATDQKSVEVWSQVGQGREDSAGQTNTPPYVQVLQPGQGGHDLYQAEVSDAGGGQAEVVEAGDDLGHLDQALLTHKSSPTLRQMELT